jgi:hypothetical protein
MKQRVDLCSIKQSSFGDTLRSTTGMRVPMRSFRRARWRESEERCIRVLSVASVERFAPDTSTSRNSGVLRCYSTCVNCLAVQMMVDFAHLAPPRAGAAVHGAALGHSIATRSGLRCGSPGTGNRRPRQADPANPNCTCVSRMVERPGGARDPRGAGVDQRQVIRRDGMSYVCSVRGFTVHRVVREAPAEHSTLRTTLAN